MNATTHTHLNMKTTLSILFAAFLFVSVNSRAQLTVNVTPTNASSCSACNGMASAVPSNGVPPYTYMWFPNGATTATVTGLCPGNYAVVVQDAHGDTTAGFTTVGPFFSDSMSATTTCFNNGTATVYAYGATPPYTYLWSNGATTSSINGLTASVYTVTVTNGGGCTTTDSIAVNNTMFNLNDSIVNTACNSNTGSVTLYLSGGVPPYGYNWSNGATTSSVSGLPFGVINVTVYDSHGCISGGSFLIGRDSIYANINSNNGTCGANNGSASASPYGGLAPYTYTWSNGSTNSSINNLSNGTYTVTISDAGGCNSVDSAVINNNGNLPLIDSAYDASCAPNSGTAWVTPLGGSAPYTYQWSNGGTTDTITGLSAGVYTVTVTASGGCTGTDSVYVSYAAPFSVYINSNPDYCNINDGAAWANVYGGGVPPFTYLWSNGNTTDSIGGLSAGTYTLTTTDNGGCSVTDSVTITTSGLGLYALSISGDCAGNNGGAFAYAQGGVPPYTYSWMPNGGSSDTAIGLSQGTYTVTVSDSHGCSATASVYIDTTHGFTFTNLVTSDTGTCNGTAQIVLHNMYGGFYTYTYFSILQNRWISGYSFNDTINLDSLCTGPYVVYINSDSNWCTLPDAFFLLGPSGVPVIANAPSGFKLYPNPAKDQISLEIEQGKGDCSIDIYNVMGQLIMQNKNIVISSDDPRSIDISQLPEGQYMLRVYNTSYSKTLPFVVSH